MKANILTSLSVGQLKRALELREQIEKLENELSSILGEAPAAAPAPGKGLAAVASAPGAKKGKRVMSAEWKAKIAAAQSRRWAKARAEKAAKLAPIASSVKPKFEPLAKKPAAGKKVMSAETKAKIGAAMRAKHAKAKAFRKF